MEKSTGETLPNSTIEATGLRVRVVSEINSNLSIVNDNAQLPLRESKKRPSDETESDLMKKPRISQQTKETCSEKSNSETTTENTEPIPREIESNNNVGSEASEKEISNVKITENSNAQPLELAQIKKEIIVDESPEPVTEKSNDIKPLIVPIKKEEIRESCKYGVRCYRKNPQHRLEQAHPGDLDYRRPRYPSPPSGTPGCPFGNLCYRRNPIHFQEYSHPKETDFNVNWRNEQIQKARRQVRIDVEEEDDDDDEDVDDDDDDDENDPFHDSDDDGDIDFYEEEEDYDDDDDDDEEADSAFDEPASEIE